VAPKRRHSAIDGRTTRHPPFIAVTAWLDIRYGARAGGLIAEFSWEGVGEGDPRSGRGWVAPGTAGRLVGHFCFHMGDGSGFVCEPR
jgi:hypothetical protein